MFERDDSTGNSPEDQAARKLREAAERAVRRVQIREHGPPESAVWQPGDTPLAELRKAVNDTIHATVAGETDWFVIDSVSLPTHDDEVVIGLWRPLKPE